MGCYEFRTNARNPQIPRAAVKEERIDLRLIDLADWTRKPACSDFVTPTGALNICTNRAQGAAALI